MIPSYCYERVEANLKAIEKLKIHRANILAFRDIKAVINELTDEIRAFDRSNLYQVNGKDALELLADNLHVAYDGAHNLIVGIDSVTHEFIRASLEEFHKCAGGEHE